MSLFGSWRPSLRMARRDAVRARGRSVLVLVMIALPVLAVTAADVVIQTGQVSGDEALDRRLGQADARVSFEMDASRVYQSFDPDGGSLSTECCEEQATPPGLDTIATALERDVTGLAMRSGTVEVRTDMGIGYVEATETDLGDPLARGMFELKEGAFVPGPGEVVINPELAERGFGIGDDLEVVDGKTLTIVGIVESTTYRDLRIAVGGPGSLSVPDDYSSNWFIDAGPVSWDDVLALNAVGATVLSRDVMLDPPPDSALPAEVSSGFGNSNETFAVALLVVVMALIEVVLLAGPAFAVGARRQARNLALMAATGGTPRQARRVVLAGAVVLGSVGAALGTVLGIGVAWAVLPIVQRYSGTWLGPFDVPWLHLVGIAGFGLLSALLAAVVPAWIASRQDVVAVLAGRRGDRAPNLRSPILGLVLLGVGIAGSVAGATGAGEFAIAFSAIPAVLGMILLVPIVVVGVARLARRLPLSMRFAVRDAARHRTRTVPAVAAVAATVAGVVALGIANSSDAAQNRETYQAQLPAGDGVITSYDADAAVLTSAAEIVDREIPDATVTPVRGIVEGRPTGESAYLEFRVPGAGTDGLLDEYALPYGSSVLVSDGEWPAVLGFVADADEPRARAAIAAGDVVVFSSRPVDQREVKITGFHSDGEGNDRRVRPVTVPATYVEVEGQAQLVGVLPRRVARDLEVPVAATALSVTDADITAAQETDVSEGVAGLSTDMSFYVERGYQNEDETMLLLLVLGALGALLMVGGTLTATFLALSDARPDLATLAAVGASPRTRRSVASSYALVVGLVGALLGAAVGFIPGIAVSYPLTGGYTDYSGAVVGPYIDIPWLMIGAVVLLLPLLTAAIVGLAARSRLPLVARVD